MFAHVVAAFWNVCPSGGRHFELFAHVVVAILNLNCRQAELRQSLEMKRREAVWDLFQSESAFLRHHLMALKNVGSFLGLS